MHMNEFYVRERIASLRGLKNVSAREMSISLAQNENYINRIENGKALPSMTALFGICDYFNITMKEFFEEENKDPEFMKEIIRDIYFLDHRQMEHIHEIIKYIIKK